MKPEKIQELETAIQRDCPNVTGVVVRKNGGTVYEAYWNGATARHAAHIFSCTKSVISALIGIAIHQGHIHGVDQRVLDFFPEYRVLPGETTIQNITLRHLLTMTAPYKYDEEPYLEFFASEDPIRAALDLLGGDKPIGEFHYSAIGGTHILSGILARATGRSVLDFATEYLFGPLGLYVPHDLPLRDEAEHMAVMNDPDTVGWAVDPQGNNTAGWGLFLRPEDMAKFGQLYLDGGRWDGRQVLPPEWVRESTRVHSRWGELSYGYLWWVVDEDGPVYAAMGDGGNVIYVDGGTGLVVAMAARYAPQVEDRIDFIQTHIAPVFA